jgi:hypothetical protein
MRPENGIGKLGNENHYGQYGFLNWLHLSFMRILPILTLDGNVWREGFEDI